MRCGRIIGAIGLATLLFMGCSDDSASADAGVDAVADVASDAVADAVPDAVADATGDTDVPVGPTGCVPPSCDDGNQCTVDECDTALLTCKHTPKTDGAACGCLDAGQCFASTCVGGNGVCDSNAQCDDGFGCTADRCDGCKCVTEVIPDCVE
ncbi:MAG: hypothetical protein R3F39_10790 [Myxococcota bacterium]